MSTASTAIAIPALRISSRETVHFYEAAFGARLAFITPENGDTVEHAELTIGGAMFMCGTGQEGGLDQEPGGSSTYWVLQAGPEVDALYQQAMAAGATEERAPYDADYGGRHFTVADPDGNHWSFGTYRPQGI
jgi:uncharacterized glyoxalase superfamily protein PhnB